MWLLNILQVTHNSNIDGTNIIYLKKTGSNMIFNITFRGWFEYFKQLLCWVRKAMISQQNIAVKTEWTSYSFHYSRQHQTWVDRCLESCPSQTNLCPGKYKQKHSQSKILYQNIDDDDDNDDDLQWSKCPIKKIDNELLYMPLHVDCYKLKFQASIKTSVKLCTYLNHCKWTEWWGKLDIVYHHIF